MMTIMHACWDACQYDDDHDGFNTCYQRWCMKIQRNDGDDDLIETAKGSLRTFQGYPRLS
jgi:hypothetical protein